MVEAVVVAAGGLGREADQRLVAGLDLLGGQDQPSCVLVQPGDIIIIIAIFIIYSLSFSSLSLSSSFSSLSLSYSLAERPLHAGCLYQVGLPEVGDDRLVIPLPRGNEVLVPLELAQQDLEEHHYHQHHHF